MLLSQTRQAILYATLLLCAISITPKAIGRSQNTKKPKSKTPVSIPRAAEHITAEQLKDYVDFIASDELEGRDTPSRGLDIAAKFIALRLSH